MAPASKGALLNIHYYYDNIIITFMKSLVSADPDIFQIIIILLVLVCTLPASYAEAERSLSVLRLIKGHLRSRMADTRFSALT